MLEPRRERVEQLLDAARRLVARERPEGRALRRRLLETSGLSAEGIELGLARCLEVSPGSAELENLLASTPVSERAHVLLSGNVFVAALRAIAIGLASSPRVVVRASRRDPALTEALHALRPGLFELRPELRPEAGDHAWCYGSDATLSAVRAALPRGVRFHGHGSGFGAVVVDARDFSEEDARAIALDTALFDRRGCLSPHLVCVIGSPSQARDVARALARTLAASEQELPPGPATADELAQARRSRDAATYAYDVFDAGSGWVSYMSEATLPPPGRVLHVVPTTHVVDCLSPWSRWLTCVATNDDAIAEQLGSIFPGARSAELGEMQRPPLDGPVDRRVSPLGELC